MIHHIMNDMINIVPKVSTFLMLSDPPRASPPTYWDFAQLAGYDATHFIDPQAN